MNHTRERVVGGRQERRGKGEHFRDHFDCLAKGATVAGQNRLHAMVAS